LGFEAGYLLGATDKKVILLYRRDLEPKLSLLITGNSHANCTVAAYSVERGDDSGSPLVLSVELIAEKFIQYYWRQAVPV
jgi:hypothetical protein